MIEKHGAILLILFSAVLRGDAVSQESAPAQPPGEAQIAQEFQKAAPMLFKEWTERRMAAQSGKGLGQHIKPELCHGWTHFRFEECKDRVPITDYRLDVTRTDSILTPFLGHLYVHMDEVCDVRNVVGVKGMNLEKNEESMTTLEPSCVGKTYEACIAAGGRDAPRLIGSACTGGPHFTSLYNGEVDLIYRWSQGKWEFQEEKRGKPVSEKQEAWKGEGEGRQR
jgi:hypothetical protein